MAIAGGKKLSINEKLAKPKVDIVLCRHDDCYDDHDPERSSPSFPFSSPCSPSPAPFFSTGDLIEGHIVFTPQYPVSVRNVAVSFEG